MTKRIWLRREKEVKWNQMIGGKGQEKRVL